jgi:hypothetical protein
MMDAVLGAFGNAAMLAGQGSLVRNQRGPATVIALGWPKEPLFLPGGFQGEWEGGRPETA